MDAVHRIIALEPVHSHPPASVAEPGGRCTVCGEPTPAFHLVASDGTVLHVGCFSPGAGAE